MINYKKNKEELKYYVDNLEDSLEDLKIKNNKENREDVIERVADLQKCLFTLKEYISNIYIPYDNKKEIKVIVRPIKGDIESIKTIYEELNKRILDFEKNMNEENRVNVFIEINYIRKNLNVLKKDFIKKYLK